MRRIQNRLIRVDIEAYTVRENDYPVDFGRDGFSLPADCACC